MTYAEYLKANGATEDEIKVLDTTVSRRAFDKSQAEAEEARAAATKLEQTMQSYEQRVNSWYQENDEKLKGVQNRAITAEAEAAKARAALLEAQRQGLVNVTKDLGYDPEPAKPATPAAVDDRYLTMEKFTAAGDTFAANLTSMLDAANEHARLFPNIPFNAEQLRREAQAQGKTMLPYWEEKYKVRDAREQAAQKQRDNEIAKWKAEGAKEAETKLASLYGNPEMRPMVPSKSPFTVRKDDPMRADNQPWNKSESQLSNDRVTRAAQKLIERQNSGNFNN
jgi:hypothetical protein